LATDRKKTKIIFTRKKEKMKKIITFTLILMALTACTNFQITVSQTAGTDVPINMPNPASLYCEENGNTLEIQTAADGSQSGVCIFPDGSSCDEWAYFRGECGPATQEPTLPVVTVEATTEGSGGSTAPETAEAIADWWGVIKSTDAGAQFDDYFERQDIPGQVIYFGIDSLDPAVKAQIEAVRDTGKIVHLYGTLFSNVPDYNGSQVQVDRIEVEG
jgi:putative hemolysin